MIILKANTFTFWENHSGADKIKPNVFPKVQRF